MEKKVVLYNHNNVKIGETFIRRARQLVRQQRAMWTDDSETAVRFAPGMENMSTEADDVAEEVVAPNHLCFARWRDGYYYPGIISEILPNHVRVAFLLDDEGSGLVSKEDIVQLQEAFNTMDFQGKYEYGWRFYNGVLTNHQPLIMRYDDGDVEQLDLRQLRGIPAMRV
ncbi:MAG: hypothetical protein FWC32_06765 [Firmicutes bacterium]|nr:hypothetical protein [Bacillota bacterium]